MNLYDYRQSYYEFSGASSAVTRQAAFAGIALVWIFNSQSASGIVLPRSLLWPTFFLIACLACDLLHYITASAIWGFFHRLKEKQGVSLDHELKAPIYLNWPSLGLFWSKHLFVIFGYAGLLAFVYNAIKFSGT